MKIIESPREAMQGLGRFIPTGLKVRYINAVLKAGFDTVEAGSSVSPKAIPQMQDTLEVIKHLDLSDTRSSLMVLVVNKKGADIIGAMNEVSCLSYPFSFSAEFLKRNLNSTYEEALDSIDYIANLCARNKKTLVLYISMAFGNPYGEPWLPEQLLESVEIMQQMGIGIIPLSNVSVPLDKKTITDVYSMLIPEFPGIEFGLHLHISDDHWYEKVDAAYRQGCRRYDGVIGGLGGCPMADKELLGNLKTEDLLEYMGRNHITTGIDPRAFGHATQLAKLYLS
jgi:hydroxymethylglutaryl-CoA lyase